MFDLVKHIATDMCVERGLDPETECYLCDGVTVPLWTDYAGEAVSAAIRVLETLHQNADEAFSELYGKEFSEKFRRVMNVAVEALDPHHPPLDGEPNSS